MQPQTIKKLHSWHAWSGLLSGINIFILSVTGAILVFVHELHHAIGPELPLHITTDRPEAYADAPLAPVVAAMQAENPAAVPAGLGIPTVADHAEDPDHFIYFLEMHPADDVGGSDHDRHIAYFFDPLTREFAPKSDVVDIPEWIWYLHANLFLGFAGQIFLGIVGIAFLISTVTGLIIYGPFMKGVFFGALRRGLTWRLLLADWHKLIGIGTLGFNLLMAVTGILLTLGQVLINLYSYSVISSLEPVAFEEGASRHAIVSVDQVVATARETFPDKNLRWISFPGQLQGDHHYVAFAYEEGRFFSRIPYVALINAYDAELSLTVDLPWYITMIYIAVPLHFGDFGGLPLRIVYAFFGLSAGALSVTGFIMYAIKYRRRRYEGVDSDVANQNTPAASRETARSISGGLS